ncbi:hypothetical protein FIBSPDRAFT_957097 [Athelia psychrophila]|uniref:Uncharacterized protein n=1 Tax=Athelia psychrophila TaxID=1759441 RepID=A0A166G4R3_9AGAM|nr:hypothetical protein FIBSPDRAFT_957097 [Fibularhizoctonia sp. CBS 109695]
MWLEPEPEDVAGGLDVQGQQDAEEATVTLTSTLGSGSLPMQPGAILYLILSPPGSTAASDTKKHSLTLAQHFPPTPLRHAANHLLPSPLGFSLKQVQSSTGISAGASDLADPKDGTHITALLTGKIVDCILSGMVAKGIQLGC